MILNPCTLCFVVSYIVIIWHNWYVLILNIFVFFSSSKFEVSWEKLKNKAIKRIAFRYPKVIDSYFRWSELSWQLRLWLNTFWLNIEFSIQKNSKTFSRCFLSIFYLINAHMHNFFLCLFVNLLNYIICYWVHERTYTGVVLFCLRNFDM